MPVYDYMCLDCKKEFTVTITLKKYEEGKIECPDCKGKNFTRILAPFFANTSKKS